jgi:uncharacterized protein (TIGR03437 family)
MNLGRIALAAASVFSGVALAQTPTVGGLLNNYSFTLPGLPNYGIAQGSIFDIFGTNLAATSAPLQGPPLQSTLNNVTINVTVNGVTTHPLFYYLGPTQIDAVLPSATPVGTGTITVTTPAGTSAAFPITVVESAFGLLTANNGSGPVQGYDANNNGALFNFSAAVNPGATLELWGTGLGPVANDATYVQVTPTAQVFIGGVAADVVYAGRSGYTGLDQINVKVPTNISGCYVSVVVQTGSFVSNFGTLPVAATGRTCSDSDNALTSSILSSAETGGNLSVGLIEVAQFTTPGVTVEGVTVGGTTIDTGVATFAKISSAQINAGAFAEVLGGYASSGSCFVDFFQTSTTTVSAFPLAFQFTSLNAGPDVNLTGPDGTIAMPLIVKNNVDSYNVPAGTTFIPSSGGAFSFDNGSGGPDVGAFKAAINMPASVTFDTSTLATVTRANGLTVNWTGGASGSDVAISGFSLLPVSSGSTTYNVGFFACRAPSSAGTFTVPASVLLSLPPSFVITEGGVSIPASYLMLNSWAPLTTFTATGLDLGLVEAGWETLVSSTFK